jgi:hypothetical protein
MDDKTRLHFIKINVVLPKNNGQVKNLYNKDFEWLIEQAEKVDMLEQENGNMAEKHAEKDILFNLIQTSMQKRVDYLLEALEDISTEICLSRHDSAERALSLIRKANQKDIQFREELKKDFMS